MLVACSGNDGVSSDNENTNEGIKDEVDIETLSEKEYNIEIFNNEDITMTLKRVEHVKVDITEMISIYTEVENKQNRTFEFAISDISTDGIEHTLSSIYFDDNVVGANETMTFEFGVFSQDEELSAEEHLKSYMKYMDYEGNVNDIEFNKYINE